MLSTIDCTFQMTWYSMVCELYLSNANFKNHKLGKKLKNKETHLFLYDLASMLSSKKNYSANLLSLIDKGLLQLSIVLEGGCGSSLRNLSISSNRLSLLA